MNSYVLLIVLITIGARAQPYHYDDDDGPAHYKFEYGVRDLHSGDVKSQHEHLDGKHLSGGYILKEPDGTKRVVEYFSDPHDGFHAIVKRLGRAQHPAHYGSHKIGGHGGTSYVGVIHYGYHH